jgi:L-arabinonolactonase
MVQLPVSRPTACTFGGADLATLYVTTARFRLAPDKLAAEVHAGGLLALDVGVKGLPEPLYSG